MEISGNRTLGSTTSTVRTPREDNTVEKQDRKREQIEDERRYAPRDQGKEITANRDGDTVALS